jgi:hypothetical protein
VDVAPWPRHRLRDISREYFPRSSQSSADHVPTISSVGRAARRSHDSRAYERRFMLRFKRAPRKRLQALAKWFNTSQAEVMRQLMAQARPEAFPESWHRAVAE